MANREEYNNALKLRKLVQKEFKVSSDEDIVLLSNLLSSIILNSEAKALYRIFGYNQTNRLALRRLQSAFRLLKKANLLKVNY